MKECLVSVWEQRKLEDIYGSIGNAFVGTATPYYVESGHFYLESNNIKDGQINHNTEVFINDEFYEKQKDKWLHTSDMVMVQSGHVGHAAVIPEELNNSAAHALIMFRNPKEEIEPYFLNYQYQTLKSKKKIENITTGNTIKHILASEMQQFEVDMPELAEQKKIAEYFSGLDRLITLHQRKHFDLLKARKNDWEQRKVSEMFKVTRGYVLPATDTSQEITDEMPYPVYSSQTKDNGLMGYYSDYLYEDAITWTTDGANAGTVNFRAGKFYCTNVCGVLLSDKIETSKVIAEALNNVAKRYVSYVGNPKLMNNVMADIQIAVPTSKRERDQISSYFSCLDRLITLHQQK